MMTVKRIFKIPCCVKYVKMCIGPMLNYYIANYICIDKQVNYNV